MNPPTTPTPDPNSRPDAYAWLTVGALDVAPRLLGWELVSHAAGAETAGRIVEVEAYHGEADPASHAFRGPTTRTAPMFEAGGAIYVYLSYGIHSCLNIVTGPAGEAQAALIRALEPTAGLETMAARRGTSDRRRLARGPGSVGQALAVTLGLSGSRLGQGVLELRPPAEPPAPSQIMAGPRIGITKAAGHPWRFYLAGNHFVSRFVSRPQI